MANANKLKQDTKKAATFTAIDKQANTPPAVFSDQNEIDATETTETSAPESPYKIYLNNIYSYIDEFIESEYAGLTDNELKENRAFFPALVQYLYNNYIGELLGNKLEYKLDGHKPIYNNIKLLDSLFEIYVMLVYKYKNNNRPSILEYCIFTGISRDTVYKWLNGDIDSIILQSVSDDRRKYITSEYADTVQKWQAICEQSLIDGKDTIKELFILKCKYGYQEKNDINVIVNHKNIIDADVLPDLIGINSKN